MEGRIILCRTLFFIILPYMILPSSSSAQQNPDGKLPVTTFPKPYLFLIRDPIVHSDLQLNSRQRDEIGALNDALDVSLWSMRNKSAKHVTETTQKAIQTAQDRLSSILTASQRKRLGQIELWTQGMTAFAYEELPARLKLSDMQREKVRDIVKETKQAVDELVKKIQDGGSRQALEKQAKELRTDEQKKILGILSRSQQQQWIALLGKRIDVAKLGRVKFKAPELSQGDAWINSSPTSFQQLKGKVVALHFYAFA